MLVWNSVLYTCMYIHFQHVEFRKQWKVDTILEDFEAPEVGGEREGKEGKEERREVGRREKEERREVGRSEGKEERREVGRREKEEGREVGRREKEEGREVGRREGRVLSCTRCGTREGGGGVHSMWD